MAEFRLPEDVLDILKNIERSAKSLLKTLSDVFDMSKFESGQVTIVKEEFDMMTLIEELLAPFKVRANSMSYNFTYSVDRSIRGKYFADTLRISQIIINILDNAFKYSYKSLSKISLAIKPHEDYTIGCDDYADYKWIEIIIEDEGIGIPDDKMDFIFNIFTQIDSSYSRIYGGTGLGLAIASSIAHLLGGHIAVESKLNVGSKFTVVLPLYSADSKSKYDNQNYELPAQEEKELFKILIAEDDLANKFLIESILKQTNKFTLSFAKNGDEAIQHFTENRYDLVLMDIKMPILDGELATRRIREIEKTNKTTPIPIIGVTAQSSMGNKDRYIDAGMNDLIFKPFANASLLRIININLPG